MCLQPVVQSYRHLCPGNVQPNRQCGSLFAQFWLLYGLITYMQRALMLHALTDVALIVASFRCF